MANARFMYWNGMNTAADLTPEEFQKFNDFYSNVHILEVVQMNPGFIRATRYELMEKDPRPGVTLTRAEREMIVVATSGANHCQYCVVAHGAILRIRARDPLLADQVAINYRKADITPRQKAMLAFAMKLSGDSASVNDADLAVLTEHGFSQDDIWDIGAITAFFALSNRMANFTSMRPNDEFYRMGRG